MRIPFSIIAALLLASSSQAQGGMPYCVWQDPDTDQYHFARLDASDGSMALIAPIPGMSAFVGGNKTTYNANSDHYHFAGLDVPAIRYYTIDALTGSILSQPEMEENVVGIEFDCKESRHFGLRETDDIYDLVEIDPITAMVTSITPVTNLQGYVAESFNFDPRYGLYTFVAYLGGFYHLRSYNVYSGALIYNVPFEDHYIAPEFNCMDSSIYALWEDEEVYKLERIQQDGQHSTVSILDGVTPGFVLESSSISQEGFYTYRGFNANNQFALISIEVATGAVIYNTQTSDNAVGFEEALCCAPIPLTVGDHSGASGILFHPQPTSDVLNIHTEVPIREVRILSLSGALLIRYEDRKGAERIAINLSALPCGTYLAEVLGMDGLLTRGPLVVVR